MKFITKLLGTLITASLLVLSINQSQAQTMCTMQYDPVCGVDGKTYGNSCMAQGVAIAYQGECQSDQQVDAPQNNGEVICTEEYEPVCGEVQVQCVRAPCPPIRTTYGNACQAKAAGATIVFEAECNIAESGPIEIPGNIDELPMINASLQQKITWANNRNITKYDTEVSFMPEQLLTREQAAKMLVATIQAQSYLNIPLMEKNCSFNDQASIDSTLSDDVQIACQYGLFQGYKGNFMPTKFMNDTDAMTILGRIATHSPAINLYLASSTFIKPNYQPMTRAMFLDWLYTMSMYVDSHQDIEKIPMLIQAQADLDAARDQWEHNGQQSYTIVQTKTCFCLEDYTRPIQYRVEEGTIVSGAVYVDTMASIDTNKSPELHTVEQAFAMIQQAIDDEVDSVTVEYDAQWGYPINIAIDQSTMMADEEQYYSFDIKNSSGTTISGNTTLQGQYQLVSYNGINNSKSGVTLSFSGERMGAKICNSIGANYSTSGSVIMFDQMVSTKMYCIDENLNNLESSFGSTNQATYTVSGNTLTLKSNNHTWVWTK